MLKNKIYKYLTIEIFKNFITILLTFTAIAWTVRAVNFLDLMIEDGYSALIYFKYSMLNISAITTRFIPLSFLLSMVVSITKFERQNELQILWTAGLNKIKIANIFFLIGFLVSFFQIILSVIVNPYVLNKSRGLLKDTKNTQIQSMLKTNDFSDGFDGVTFYIDEKNSNDELINIFIKDINGSLDTIINEAQDSENTTVLAEKGFFFNNKIVLFNGTIQTLNSKKEIKNINFEKTELSIANFSKRTIVNSKIQETSTLKLFTCLMDVESNQSLIKCPHKNSKKTTIETLSRRVGMPLYVPLISVIASFLLIYKKEKKYNFLKKYIVFGFTFIILVFSEILLRYVGFSLTSFMLYFLFPLILLVALYSLLVKNMISERVVK